MLLSDQLNLVSDQIDLAWNPKLHPRGKDGEFVDKLGGVTRHIPDSAFTVDELRKYGLEPGGKLNDEQAHQLRGIVDPAKAPASLPPDQQAIADEVVRQLRGSDDLHRMAQAAEDINLYSRKEAEATERHIRNLEHRREEAENHKLRRKLTIRMAFIAVGLVAAAILHHEELPEAWAAIFEVFPEVTRELVEFFKRI